MLPERSNRSPPAPCASSCRTHTRAAAWVPATSYLTFIFSFLMSDDVCGVYFAVLMSDDTLLLQVAGALRDFEGKLALLEAKASTMEPRGNYKISILPRAVASKFMGAETVHMYE